MHGMLNRCIDTGLKLNPDKCFVKQEKIKFYRVICGQDSVQPDPGSHCFETDVFPYKSPGTANLLRASKLHGSIILSLSTQRAPLRELLKEDNHFKLYAAHQESFNKTKDSISNEIILIYFDPMK